MSSKHKEDICNDDPEHGPYIGSPVVRLVPKLEPISVEKDVVKFSGVLDRLCIAYETYVLKHIVFSDVNEVCKHYKHISWNFNAQKWQMEKKLEFID